MINWVDIILIIALAAAGTFGFWKAESGKYVLIMTAAGFSMAVAVGLYEYLGGTWGDTSFTHGASLVVLFIISIVFVMIVRKRGIICPRNEYPKIYFKINRIINALILTLTAAMFSVMFMALMVKVAGWMLEADKLSRSVEIFINGVIGSSMTKEMVRLSGYPAIIIGSVVTIAGMLVSNNRFVKRLSIVLAR